MKRILHVANFNSLRLKGCFQCGFPIKISTGLIKNGYEVVNYPDRDLCRMFGLGHMNWLGRKRLNQHLIKFCKVIRPDAILFGHADTIENETIEEIKKMFPNIPMMQWNCDSIKEGEFDRNIKALEKKLPYMDVTMISTGDKKQLNRFQRDGKIVAHLPNMVDRAVETGETHKQESLPYDVFFCATTEKRQFCGEKVELESIMDKAWKKVPEIKWLLAGIKDAPLLNGYEYLDAFKKAAMGFNISRNNNIYLYSSDRIAHIMGNGQMAVVDRRCGFEDILGKDSAGFYTEEEEFFDLLSFYKQNPQARMKIAKNGYEAYYREFNNDYVTKYMADLLFGNFKQAERDWQITL